jgi:N4-gp56 family major capsid protein
MLSTGTTNFSNTLTALVLKQIEKNLRSASVYLQEGAFIRGDLIPGTNLIRHVAYSDLSVTTNANVIDNTPPVTPPWLEEGVPPAEEALTITYEEYGVAQAGRLVAISDIALAQSPHELMSIAAERVGTNAGQTIDLFIGNVLHAGTARLLYAGAATSRVTIAATHNMTGALIRRAVAILKASNVPTFPDGTYHAFIHPFVLHDLQGDVASTGAWWDANRYASPENFLTGEVGQFMGVRFVQATVGSEFLNSGVGGTVDVYSTYVFGPDSFAFGDLQSVQAYMVSPGGDHLDPLAQKAQVGWKAMWGAKLMGIAGSGNRYIRIEAASSIGANT